MRIDVRYSHAQCWSKIGKILETTLFLALKVDRIFEIGFIFRILFHRFYAISGQVVNIDAVILYNEISILKIND